MLRRLRFHKVLGLSRLSARSALQSVLRFEVSTGDPRPSKQFFDLGVGVPLNQKSAGGYSLAVLAIVTLPSFFPLLILQFETKILADYTELECY